MNLEARSPDLVTLYFHLWGYRNNHVFSVQIQHGSHMEEWIG